jgi:DNA-binding transcriptional ArsR family regulator
VLSSYWELAVEPYWPGISAALQAEIAQGARQMAEGGIEVLLDSLHPQYCVTDDALQIRNWSGHAWAADVTGRHLILLPSVFSWPRAGLDPNLDGPLSLIYGPRQVGGLWEDDPAAGDADPLGHLLGRSRAAILRTIAAPASTSTLSRDLKQSPAAVSAHLSTLVRTGLATSWRSGRYVLYQRTPLADRLINATGGPPDPGA